jgi:hypothetical protein
MGVRSALVGCAGDDGRSVGSVLVRNIVDRESIFVVPIADVAAIVLLVRASIQHALGVVNVAVQFGAPRTVWVGDVVNIDVDQSGSAGAGARLSPDGDGISELLILLHISEYPKHNEEEQRLYDDDSPLRRCENGQQVGR